MSSVKKVVSLLLLAAVGAQAETRLAEGSASGEAYFEKRIRPLLATHCYECHSEESGKQKGGLRLDLRAGWETGGDHGPAIIPGEPDRSLLLRAVSYADSDLQMPPEKRLSEEEQSYLREWISLGAPDPRSGSVEVSEVANDAAARAHWAFQPMEVAPVPKISDSSWAHSPADRFVEQRRREAGLQAAADADVHTLLRRYHVTLTGLTPTVEQIRTFLGEEQTADRQHSWGRLVDRLLASPRFGEHWGRHWLDVTRFAESSGGGRSLMFKNAWHFRDYAIRAFNDDVPYDVLVREHVAGDLLFRQEPLNAARQRDRLIGSGFLALGPTNYELQDKELLRMEVVDEQIDSVGRAFLGMTLGCARCHDHKFDPISTEEYYALAGIFRSTKTITPGNVSGYVETPLPGPGYEERQTYERQLEKLKGDLELAENRKKKRADLLKTGSGVPRISVGQLKKELEALKKTAPPALPMAMSVRDETGDEVADSPVHIRGAIRSLGERVPRGFLTVATPEGVPATPNLGPSESGRLALADWIMHRQHPLTARVYVNRLWHHVMGSGIVRTVDNFGLTGEAPSHPQLLDDLAHDFVARGSWSAKRMIRMMVLSRTFQLGGAGSSAVAGDRGEIDPENRLLWRAHERQLSAESLRDSLLQLSDELDLAVGGLTIEKFSAYDNGYQFGDFRRRTVYAPAFRNARLEILNLFDAANPNMVQGRRTQTTLATQALYLMNSDFVMQRAERFARRLLRERSSNDERLTRAYLEILGRPPVDVERELVEAFLTEFTSEEAWATLAHSLLASVDFRQLN